MNLIEEINKYFPEVLDWYMTVIHFLENNALMTAIEFVLGTTKNMQEKMGIPGLLLGILFTAIIWLPIALTIYVVIKIIKKIVQWIKNAIGYHF